MKSMRQYIALIHKDADSDYGVSFPDFPGCISAGQSLDEARNLAAEALAFHVAGMIEDGEVIAEPSSLEAVMADNDNRDGVAILVPLETQSKTVRVNISVPSEILDLIDRHAEANGFTRSGFIVSAARRVMGEAGREQQDPPSNLRS
jgi:predicted RNase H-like HicB family nuclease